jgi:hypothetical protein
MYDLISQPSKANVLGRQTLTGGVMRLLEQDASQP